jgi:hypothetical protein
MNYAELFIWVFLGHLVGDYWLQNTRMANNKGKPGAYGAKMCTLHASLYGVTVLLFLTAGAYINGGHPRLPLWLFLPVWFVLIAVPHWIIDRYCLLGYLMLWKNGIHPFKIVPEKEKYQLQDLWEISFTAPVYIVTDNTAHLLMMWLMIRTLL